MSTLTTFVQHCAGSSFFFNLRFCLFLERGREGEREGEKHQCVVAPSALLTGDLACNSIMCPDWELNRQLFDSQASIQSTEQHQPGLVLEILSSDIRPQKEIKGKQFGTTKK